MSYQQALQDLQSGNLDAAIAQLDLLLKTDSEQPHLWQAKALALLSSGQAKAAIAAAEQAIRLNPSMAPAHRLLGNAYSKLNQRSEAIAAYKQATRCYLEQQDKANAQACLDTIEQLRSPRPATPPMASSQSLLEAAAAKAQKGRYGDALQDLNWLLQLEPTHATALAQRGLLQAQCHNHQAAVSDFARAMQLAPDDPALYLQRGQMRLLLGDAHGAIADFSTLLKTKSDLAAQLYTLRGQSYQKVNDLENAFKDFSNALGIDPENADCYKARGEVYAATGDIQEALANYRQAAMLYLNQGNWSAHQSLQKIMQPLESQLKVQKEEAARIIRAPIKKICGGTPVIEVIFNGLYTFDMILDTGAGMTSLTQAMARSLNVIPTGTRQFRMADGWIVENPVGWVSSVAIDRAQVSNLEVAISPTATEGLLGQNYLWRYDVRILRTEVQLYLR